MDSQKHNTRLKFDVLMMKFSFKVTTKIGPPSEDLFCTTCEESKNKAAEQGEQTNLS